MNKRKIMLVGRSESGKTTLKQALRGEKIHYHKTQYVNHYEQVIDTPGEYAQSSNLGGALALYSYEADVIGLLMSAVEPFSLYPPNVTAMANREVIGIVTQIDREGANIHQAIEWLKLAGCQKIFQVSAHQHKGIDELIAYINKLEYTG